MQMLQHPVYPYRRVGRKGHGENIVLYAGKTVKREDFLLRKGV